MTIFDSKETCRDTFLVIQGDINDDPKFNLELKVLAPLTGKLTIFPPLDGLEVDAVTKWWKEIPTGSSRPMYTLCSSQREASLRTTAYHTRRRDILASCVSKCSHLTVGIDFSFIPGYWELVDDVILCCQGMLQEVGILDATVKEGLASSSRPQDETQGTSVLGENAQGDTLLPDPAKDANILTAIFEEVVSSFEPIQGDVDKYGVGVDDEASSRSIGETFLAGGSGYPRSAFDDLDTNVWPKLDDISIQAIAETRGISDMVVNSPLLDDGAVVPPIPPSTQASVFQAERIFSEVEQMAVEYCGKSVINKAIQANASIVPQLRVKFEKLYLKISSLGVNASPLKERVEDYLQQVIHLDSAKYSYAKRMSITDYKCQHTTLSLKLSEARDILHNEDEQLNHQRTRDAQRWARIEALEAELKELKDEDKASVASLSARELQQAENQKIVQELSSQLAMLEEIKPLSSQEARALATMEELAISAKEELRGFKWF